MIGDAELDFDFRLRLNSTWRIFLEVEVIAKLAVSLSTSNSSPTFFGCERLYES
jgi:hypothetical protein